MPRFRRLIPPGRLVHFIARFVNDAFRLGKQEERDAYMRRVGRQLCESDWRLLAYATMSSHIHLALISGAVPFAAWSRPVHASFSAWLNRRQGCRGPLFAERPKTILLPIEQVPRLIAYIHNNPVRAGVVESASQSAWSSHNAYASQKNRKKWLDVQMGLHLCGFSDDLTGRSAFGSFVAEQASCKRDPLMEGDKINEWRRAMRFNLGSAVELSYPEVDQEGRTHISIVGADGQLIQPRWEGSLCALVRRVEEAFELPRSILSTKNRLRRVCAGRRMVVLIAHHYWGRSLREIGAVVGITGEAAGQLLARATAEQYALGKQLAGKLYGKL